MPGPHVPQFFPKQQSAIHQQTLLLQQQQQQAAVQLNQQQEVLAAMQLQMQELQAQLAASTAKVGQGNEQPGGKRSRCE